MIQINVLILFVVAAIAPILAHGHPSVQCVLTFPRLTGSYAHSKPLYQAARTPTSINSVGGSLMEAPLFCKNMPIFHDPLCSLL